MAPDRRTASSAASGPPLPGWRFAEEDFPVAAAHAAEYSRICQRGYARMRRRRVVVAGLCRDVERVLPATIRRIEHLGGLFADYRVVIYENDSRDATKALLRRWAVGNRRVTAVTENVGDPVNPVRRCTSRAARMAAYRTRCQQAILERHRHCDDVILVDMDLVGGWSEDGVANTFGHDDWDVVGANGLVYRRCGLAINELRQYDTWAYRADDALQASASGDVARLVPERGAPLIRVGSCFGGLGVYRMEAFAVGTYEGDDCEHVAFHRSLVRRGLTGIFLNPSQIALYGRRHRSTDCAARWILRAWSHLAGGPPAAWRFDGSAAEAGKRSPPALSGADRPARRAG